MDSFIEYIQSQGVCDAEGTALFVERFLEDPGIFFQLSGSERKRIESKIEEILFFFKD